MELTAWIRQRSRRRLSPGTYLLLSDEGGQTQAAVISLASDARDAVMRRLDMAAAVGSCGHGGAVSAFVGDVLAATSPLIAGSLQAGQLLQVVGTPRLLDGLATGAYSMAQSSGGMLGTVVNSSHQFVGHLRFAPASLSPVMGPMIVWQVIHTLAGVRHLVKIEQQLDLLQRGIREILFRQQARAYAELQAAIECIGELDEEYRVTGRFTEDMRLRLSLAARDVRCALAEERLHFERFDREKRAALAATGKDGATRAVALLKERSDYLLDADLLLMAHRASVMVHQACIVRDLEHSPECIPLRLAHIKREVDAVDDLAQSLAYVRELHAHAETCVQSLFWFRRGFRWGISAAVGAIGSVTETEADVPLETAEPALMLWKEPRGMTRAVVMDWEVTPVQ